MATGPTLENPPAHQATHDATIAPSTGTPPGTVYDLQPSADAGAGPADRSVYTRVATALTNRWLHATRPAPWLADQLPRGKRHDDVQTLYRRMSAALGVGLYRELQPGAPDRDHLFEFVRCSLIRWQASLLTDGRPACPRVRNDPLTGVIFSQVVQLLGETREFQTPLLLDDIERCVAWVAARRPQTPWIESVTVCALVEAAPLVRDSSLLKGARNRLAALLIRQDEEGWFPERGGPDIGRLSLAIDALARLYFQTEWAELVEPLRRATRFLAQVVDPGEWVKGGQGLCAPAFVSPYGVELMAGVCDEGAALARRCREQLAKRPWENFFGRSDEACVTLGATVCLAAIHARRNLPDAPSATASVNDRVDFPRAGLSIISTEAYRAVVNYKRGGAVHVAWRNGQPALNDPGLIVCRSHVAHSGSHRTPAITGEIEGNVVTCRGRLASQETVVQRAVDAMRRVFRQTQRAKKAHRARRRADRFVRRIEFRDDRVLIHDEVECHRPCESIVCQSPLPDADAFPLGAWSDSSPQRSPIFIEGGRYVRLERVYRDGLLVDTQVTRTKSARRDD